MPTNCERAERGRTILEIYAHHFGDPYDPTANLTDVLTDLVHMVTTQPELGLNFQDRLQMARLHLEAETEECNDD